MYAALTVALLAEGVDRNLDSVPGITPYYWDVALLAEGVDRNTSSMTSTPSMNVALLAEGVDRNPLCVWKSSEEEGRPPRGGRG